MNNLNLDKLDNHIFETIEMLKNNSDPDASPNEKIDVSSASAIHNLAKDILQGKKIRVNAAKLLDKASNYDQSKRILQNGGVLSKED